MKYIFLLYDTCCIYEIAALNYFLQYSGCQVEFYSLDGQPVRSMEGYSLNVDGRLKDADLAEIGCFTVPGGDSRKVDTPEVRQLLSQLKDKGVLLAGICSGVDILDKAGVLEGIKSTHSLKEDVVNDNNVITSRANGYVDFAIEVAKELRLFADEQDLKETIDFWKYHKSSEVKGETLE